MESSADATRFLTDLTEGNQEAAEKLIPVVYEELKRLAEYMRRERPDHTFQTMALVHEAYLKLISQKDATWKGHAHFVGVAAQLMRRILIDHARGHLRDKRGGETVTLPLDEALDFSPEHSKQLVNLDEALNRLSKLDARQSRVVELRFFGGLTEGEIAQLLGVSVRTVKRDWMVARAWLHSELRGGYGGNSKAVGPG